MTLEETRKRIIEDDEFVLKETKGIQFLYELKHEIRYARKRDVRDTESVAEHVYGMMMLLEYFLPLEDTERTWNHERIRRMALIHDIDEIETGDTIGYLKTDEDRAREMDSVKSVIGKLSDVLKETFTVLAEEYEKQETPESRFVKAIDRIEPLFHIYSPEGKRILNENKTTFNQSNSLKEKYVRPYPYLDRFNKVISEKMIAEEYFAPEA